MKRVGVIVIISILLGGAVGYGFSALRANASFFQDFANLFKGGAVEGSREGSSTSSERTGQTEEQEPIALYKPVLDYEEAVTSAVEKAFPSVVSIAVSKDVPVIEQCRRRSPFGNLGPEFEDFFGGGFGFEFLEPCQTGTEKREIGGGSGFIISEDGLIVTNKHVVLDTEAEYTVFTNDGEKHAANILARDPVQDLAIIKIEARGLAPAKLGDSSSIKLGQTAIAIGNALGEFRNTVSVGVVSGLAREITATGGGLTERIEGLIQTDAAINQGNSGGPLLNLRGEVIGVNTAVVSGAQNIGFAIPINEARRDITSVRETGTISFPFLGVRYQVTEEGALLRGGEDGPAVIPSSPAQEAGLQAEDLILEIDGERITQEDALGERIAKRNVGETITLKVKRGEDVLELQATLGEREE